jgi:hypothetical protein
MIDDTGYKVTMKELLLGRADFMSLEEEVKGNLIILRERLNRLRIAVGRPFKINDGLRIRGVHKPKNGAEKSKHYLGQAADVDDDDTAWLWEWCKANLDTLKEIGLWLEDPRWTHGAVGTWMHFQIVPPDSGRRIYVPSTAPASAPDLWDGVYDRKKYDAA